MVNPETNALETNVQTPLNNLSKTLEMLEKQEKVLVKKVAAEVTKAKEFTRAKNKSAAIQCLKRKRLYEQQIEQFGNFQLCILDQIIVVEKEARDPFYRWNAMDTSIKLPLHEAQIFTGYLDHFYFIAKRSHG